MTERSKHPKKELESVLLWAESQGWRVTRGKGYYMRWCPCPEQHKRTVKLSPSHPRYRRELLGWLERCTCWEEAK